MVQSTVLEEFIQDALLKLPQEEMDELVNGDIFLFATIYSKSIDHYNLAHKVSIEKGRGSF